MSDDEPDIADAGASRPGRSLAVVQVGRAGRGPGLIVAIIGLFLGVAIVKPWPVTTEPAIDLVPPSPTPTAAPTVDPLAVVRAECQEPPGWRTYTKERWAGGTLHAWTTVTPVTGHHAPIEDGIPTVPYATEVLGLGFCTPYSTEDERPPDDAHVHVWRLEAGAGAGGGAPRAELLEVTSAVDGLDLPYGALFRPPAPDPDPASDARATADRWTPGRYVFEVVGPGAGYDRWWAVQLDPPLHPVESAPVGRPSPVP